MRRVDIRAAALGLCSAFLALSAAAQTPPAITVNHNVVGWTSNRLPSTLNPDAYVCSPGSTPPGPAVTPVSARYDGNVLTPTPMTFSVPSLHVPVPEGNHPTLVQFQNLDTNGAETYVDFPFTMAAAPDSDFVLNQAFYGMNQGLLYGSQFRVRMVLVDVDNGNAEYALGGTVPVATTSALPNFGTYLFVNNQAWPLTGAPGPLNAPCGPTGKFTDSGIAGTVLTPVPLVPGNKYLLRAYLSLEAGATDRRAMIDDVMLFMQAVNVATLDDGVADPAYSFAAASGGATPSVLLNDQINAAAVPAGNFTLTQVSGDPGLTLDTTTGAITAAPGQPGTKTLTYRLCPSYNQTTVPNFASNACKTAVATVTLTGAAAPPQVSVSCTPTSLVDAAGQQAVCTVRADTVVTNALAVSLQNLAATGRYSGTCTGITSITIPAGSDNATCTVVATANTVPGDGDVTATLIIADNTALYTVGTRSASVTVRDDDAVLPAVPSLQQGVLALLGLLVAGIGALRMRQRRSV